MSKAYHEWLRKFTMDAIDKCRVLGHCNFTEDLEIFFEDLGFNIEESQILAKSIAHKTAEDLAREFKLLGYQAEIKPHNHLESEIVLKKMEW